jgi:hypothetical protein
MLVDGAVVVVENVVERLGNAREDDLPRLNQVFRATADVIVPVSAGIVIIALVFLPLLSLQGLEGKLFAPVALTIVFALAGSLLLALTLVPVLASFGLKRGHHGEPWIMRWLTPRYRRLLGGAFARKRLVYGLSATGLAVAVLAYGAVGKTFMPTMDEGSVIVQLTKLPTINLAQSTQIDMAVERALKAVPEVADVIARTGSDEIGLDPMGLNETDSFVVLKPQGEWRGDKDFVVEQLRHATQGLPGVQTTFTQPIEMRVSEMLTGARGDLAVKIFGPDTRVLADLATRIQATLKGVRGATEVLTVANDNVDYLQLNVDRVAAGRLGMPVDQLQDTLRASVEGMPAGIVAEGQRRVPIVIRGDDALRSDPTRFADMQMVTPRAPRVADMAQVARTTGPVKLDHENASRFALVQAFVSGRDLVGYVTKPRRKSRARCRCRRLSHRMGRPVRKPAARRRAADAGDPGGAAADLRRAARHPALAAGLGPDPRQHSLRHGRRHRFAVGFGRIPVGARLGRVHRPARHCRAQRPGVGRLFPPVARGRHAHGAGRAPWRGTPPAPRADDRQHHRVRPGAAAVRQRARLGNPAPAGNRGDRRAGHLHSAHAGSAADPVCALWRKRGGTRQPDRPADGREPWLTCC